MVALHKLEQWDEQAAREFSAAYDAPGGLPVLVPGHDRFDTGVRILDAVGFDLSLDSGIVDVDDLIN